MNESPHQSTDAEGNGPRGGERLAAARRAHEISATDIAKELHLDEMKIRALEKNDFAVLGAPVFAKGHLRKYAELVGVPAADVMADYYELNRSAGAPPVVGPVRKFRRDISLGPWITGGIIVVIVVGTAYWWFTRGPALSFSQVEPPRPAAFATETSSQPAAEVVTVVEPALQDAEEESPPREITLASATPLDLEADSYVEESSALPQVHVTLVFTGECWTEVTDAAGQSLFYDLGTSGRVVQLAGDEPLRLVLGDSENVAIEVDGRDYPIPDSARRGRMARLTISSQ